MTLCQPARPAHGSTDRARAIRALPIQPATAPARPPAQAPPTADPRALNYTPLFLPYPAAGARLLSSNIMASARPSSGKRFLLLVDDVYEDLELWYPRLRLVEAGATVTVAGPESGQLDTGKHGYPCRSDAALAEVRAADFTGLIVPGGFMPDKLRRHPIVLQLVRDFDAAGKLVAAICHGGWIPISAGVYCGVRVTRLAGHQERSGGRRGHLGRRARRGRPPLRLQPQAGQSAPLLPRHFPRAGR